MQLRRFTADSTPAALGAVRQALGDDAIILANRKIGDQVEIIATGQLEDAQALSEISLDSPVQRQANELQKLASSHSSTAGTTAASTTSRSTKPSDADPKSFDELTTAIDAVEPSTEQLTYGSGKQVATSLQRTEQVKTRGSVSNARASSRVSIRDEKPQTEMQKITAGINEAVARQSEQLCQVVEAQSQMINKHFKGLEVNLWGNNSPNRRLHLQRLFAMGIGAELAIQLAERAHPDASVDDALRQSFELLKSTLPIGTDKTFTVPGVTIFSGPPGAGKTTSLMKIATQHVKEHGSDSIVIICADTRRIGAFEELQAYGRLLGVPTVHAHDSAELDSLLAAFTHKQLVLIDHTLPMDTDAVELPQRLSNPDFSDTVRQLLVLSATSQSATIEAVLSRHCEGRNMQCVLTHLDASARLGELFNAVIRHHLPIAYWSDAASVQKPLQKASASVLVATAAAMSRRLVPTPDDECLLRLIQPSDELISAPAYIKKNTEVTV